MDQQPDKLFRDKLQHYDPAVPGQVWDRVAANVRPKRTPAWWLSAAAVALIGSAALVLYPLRKEPAQLAGKASEIKQQEPLYVTKDSVTRPASAEEDVLSDESLAPAPSAQAHTDEDNLPAKNLQPQRQKQPAVQHGPLPVIQVPLPEPIASAEEEDIAPSVNEETLEQPDTGRKTITIVYTATEVNEKYLSKTQQTEATSSQEEASTLKNMLDKAYDLTHNQNPLGELRQKKNEILAMNFRKDKSRTQND